MPRKPMSLLICRDWPDAYYHMALTHWPRRLGVAVKIEKAQAIVETETDRFYLFYQDDPNILMSFQIKEYYISDAAHLRPDLLKIMIEAFKRRRIQAMMPEYQR